MGQVFVEGLVIAMIQPSAFEEVPQHAGAAPEPAYEKNRLGVHHLIIAPILTNVSAASFCILYASHCFLSKAKHASSVFGRPGRSIIILRRWGFASYFRKHIHAFQFLLQRLPR